jgi:eukaryotic-like serine/threonine-protein kinase
MQWPNGQDPRVDSDIDTDAAILTSLGLPSPEATDRERTASVAMPERLGRYLVLHRVGSGGMGVVYAAYDPELDRKVAIKLLRSGADAAVVRERLLREAQVMARLSHPNVVVVYDVGTFGQHVFLAMEFVQGETLREWLEQVLEAGGASSASSSWRSVLAMLVQAGRGIAAAHDGGIIHRDFKPDNVLVDTKGRARVTDFGLARATVDANEHATTDRVRAADVFLGVDTREAGMIGTPSYMSPEQFAGERGDARSDQFSFCVALWEGLFGQRPFVADNLLALAAAVTSGALPEAPRRSGVPRWLVATLYRGLANRPEDRFPTMDALLAALERGQTRARLRRALAAVAGVAMCVVAVLGIQQMQRARAADGCDEAGARIGELWHPERRNAVREAVLTTGTSYATTTAQKVMPWIDAQAVQWKSARTEICLDAEVRGQLDPAQTERALECLDERWTQLESLLGELEQADSAISQRAVAAAAGLAPIAACRDAEQLARVPSPPPEQRDEIRDVRSRLWRADAAYLAGKYDVAIGALEPLLQEAIEIGWPRLVAEVRASLGKAYTKRGDHGLARAALVDAYLAAADVGASRLAGAAAAQLVQVIGIRLARHDDAFLWGRLAEVELHRIGADDELPWATLYGHLGTVHNAAGHRDEALSFAEKALEIRERVLGPEHPEVAANLHNIASVYRERGEYGIARELAERALAIQRNALGEDHPDIARALANLASVYGEMGDHAAALVIYENAAKIQEQALGPEHFEFAKMLANIGTLHYHMHAFDEALRVHQRALAITEKQLGPDHPDVATIMSNVGITKNAMGEQVEAIALHRRVLEIREAKLGADHVLVGAGLINLAGAQRESKAYDDALATYQRALELTEKKVGPTHLQVASCLDGIARTLVGAGRLSEAIAPAERSLAIREAAHVKPLAKAEVQLTLARALVGSGGDAVRARTLATDARDAFAGGGKNFAKESAEVNEWLAAH